MNVHEKETNKKRARPLASEPHKLGASQRIGPAPKALTLPQGRISFLEGRKSSRACQRGRTVGAETAEAERQSQVRARLIFNSLRILLNGSRLESLRMPEIQLYQA